MQCQNPHTLTQIRLLVLDLLQCLSAQQMLMKTYASDFLFKGAHRCFYSANFLTAEKTSFVCSKKQRGNDLLSKQAQLVLISRIVSQRGWRVHKNQTCSNLALAWKHTSDSQSVSQLRTNVSTASQHDNIQWCHSQHLCIFCCPSKPQLVTAVITVWEAS
jgi:hypothetical protein